MVPTMSIPGADPWSPWRGARARVELLLMSLPVYTLSIAHQAAAHTQARTEAPPHSQNPDAPPVHLRTLVTTSSAAASRPRRSCAPETESLQLLSKNSVNRGMLLHVGTDPESYTNIYLA